MTREQIMVELFEFSATTFYKWTKHEKRKIFDLLNYAFTLDELEEFITTNKIDKFNSLNNVKINDILLEKTQKIAESFGVDINSYIETLIIEDIKKIGDLKWKHIIV